ncbi:hypothetical protein A5776_23430 [Mycolicibacterium elephantis]|uniref:hypothetical protein n=1 Tax=Mycolicibacterium elephantis TaxID=81858 RepID=UPI0007EB2F4C|nr:hypothetical protein [Mycolicibacterium elephantis]OBE94331.1 hypothetical protein A5776_23430 [Mycolicibacterium elephantis]
MRIEWLKIGTSLRVAQLDGDRELLEKPGAREMLLRFVGGPVIAEAQCIGGQWVVYADRGSRELFARRVYFDKKADAIQFLVGLRKIDTTSSEARFCEIASHSWEHLSSVRDGEMLVQHQKCKRCSAERELRFDASDGKPVSDK